MEEPCHGRAGCQDGKCTVVPDSVALLPRPRSCGGDNQGLYGVEAKYDDILSGMAGSISRATDATGEEIGTEGEVYTSAINGNDIVLSIDMTIQSIVEKYLEEACIDNSCTDGGNIVVMNPKT